MSATLDDVLALAATPRVRRLLRERFGPDARVEGPRHDGDPPGEVLVHGSGGAHGTGEPMTYEEFVGEYDGRHEDPPGEDGP